MWTDHWPWQAAMAHTASLHSPSTARRQVLPPKLGPGTRGLQQQLQCQLFAEQPASCITVSQHVLLLPAVPAALDGVLVSPVCQAMAMSLAQCGDNMMLRHHAWAPVPWAVIEPV